MLCDCCQERLIPYEGNYCWGCVRNLRNALEYNKDDADIHAEVDRIAPHTPLRIKAWYRPDGESRWMAVVNVGGMKRGTYAKGTGATLAHAVADALGSNDAEE